MKNCDVTFATAIAETPAQRRSDLHFRNRHERKRSLIGLTDPQLLKEWERSLWWPQHLTTPACYSQAGTIRPTTCITAPKQRRQERYMSARRSELSGSAARPHGDAPRTLLAYFIWWLRFRWPDRSSAFT